MEKLIFKSIYFVGEIMNFKKQIILFSILAMSVMAVYAEDISTYNPQVIEKHQITNEDIASATSYGQSLVEKKNIKMISTAKKKFIKRRYGGIFPRNELQGIVYVQTPFAIFANTALEDARGVASTYSTRNATNILQVRSFLYMPESKMYNDTNNVVISIVQNGYTYYPI